MALYAIHGVYLEENMSRTIGIYNVYLLTATGRNGTKGMTILNDIKQLQSRRCAQPNDYGCPCSTNVYINSVGSCLVIVCSCSIYLGVQGYSDRQGRSARCHAMGKCMYKSATQRNSDCFWSGVRLQRGEMQGS